MDELERGSDGPRRWIELRFQVQKEATIWRFSAAAVGLSLVHLHLWKKVAVDERSPVLICPTDLFQVTSSQTP